MLTIKSRGQAPFTLLVPAILLALQAECFAFEMPGLQNQDVVPKFTPPPEPGKQDPSGQGQSQFPPSAPSRLPNNSGQTDAAPSPVPEAPPVQATMAPAAQHVIPTMPVMEAALKGVHNVGWEDTITEPFYIWQGHLYCFPQKTAPKAAAEELPGVPFSMNAKDVLILEEFKCRSIVQKALKRGNRYIIVQTFEFANSDGANAGYDLLRKGSTTVVKRGDGSSEDSDNISFWQDNFLFLIHCTSEDDDESKDVASAIANRLSQVTITHGKQPSILLRLPIVDRVKGTEKIVMGPVSASRYFNAPELQALSIEKSRAAAVADYQVLEPVRERMKLLFIDYGDNEQAKRSYDAYSASLSQLHGPERTWQDASLYKLNKSYLMCQVKQPGKLIVIFGARKSKSPMLLAGQLASFDMRSK